eukprot:m.276654 g.276654  ORF g.276654 m.276654 type:complete len:228 (-) comp125280_c0_seq1:484-1167(-)
MHYPVRLNKYTPSQRAYIIHGNSQQVIPGTHVVLEVGSPCTVKESPTICLSPLKSISTMVSLPAMVFVALGPNDFMLLRGMPMMYVTMHPPPDRGSTIHPADPILILLSGGHSGTCSSDTTPWKAITVRTEFLCQHLSNAMSLSAFPDLPRITCRSKSLLSSIVCISVTPTVIGSHFVRIVESSNTWTTLSRSTENIKAVLSTKIPFASFRCIVKSIVELTSIFSHA